MVKLGNLQQAAFASSHLPAMTALPFVRRGGLGQRRPWRCIWHLRGLLRRPLPLVPLGPVEAAQRFGASALAGGGRRGGGSRKRQKTKERWCHGKCSVQCTVSIFVAVFNIVRYCHISLAEKSKALKMLCLQDVVQNLKVTLEQTQGSISGISSNG